MSEVMQEMPRYECHKQVWALKIKEVHDNKVTTPTLVFDEDGYAPISVDWDWYYKHKPHPGGYYVVYADGYKSYSPAKAFEDGYTRICQLTPELSRAVGVGLNEMLAVNAADPTKRIRHERSNARNAALRMPQTSVGAEDQGSA